MKGLIFDSKNFILIAASVVMLVVGYILLGTGPVDNPLSLSVAPIVLVGVYCVMIPLAIVVKSKKQDSENSKK